MPRGQAALHWYELDMKWRTSLSILHAQRILDQPFSSAHNICSPMRSATPTKWYVNLFLSLWCSYPWKEHVGITCFWGPLLRMAIWVFKLFFFFVGVHLLTIEVGCKVGVGTSGRRLTDQLISLRIQAWISGWWVGTRIFEIFYVLFECSSTRCKHLENESVSRIGLFRKRRPIDQHSTNVIYPGLQASSFKASTTITAVLLFPVPLPAWNTLKKVSSMLSHEYIALLTVLLFKGAGWLEQTYSQCVARFCSFSSNEDQRPTNFRGFMGKGK